MNRNYVWDPLVRIFHWSLVVAFVVAYATGDEESMLHINAGYVILALIVIRVIWGFVGTRHARFSDFLYSPMQALKYLRDLISNKKVTNYRGHNPAGGWMVFALLFSLLATIYSGMEMEAVEGRGLLATKASLQVINIDMISSAHADDDKDVEHDEEDDGHELWEEIHEFFANVTVLLVLLHIAGVLLSSYRKNQNLVKSMFTGYKN